MVGFLAEAVAKAKRDVPKEPMPAERRFNAMQRLRR
jgi:hypothetical protein